MVWAGTVASFAVAAVLSAAPGLTPGVATGERSSVVRDTAGDEERVVAVSPLLSGFASLTRQGPSALSLLTTPAFKPVAVLPGQVGGPIFEGYAQVYQGATAGSGSLEQAVTGFEKASRPLAPLVNPVARPVGATVLESAAVAADSGAALGVLGADVSFFGYGARTFRELSGALGFAR